MFLLSITFLNQLIEWDKWLFVKVNNQWTHPFLDSVLPLWRTPEYWAPLYLFIVVFITSNFKVKGVWWIIFFVSTFALTDLTGNYAFKQVFERSRPCNDPDFYMHVRLLLKNCGAGYSFISNHAVNHFGMAVFMFMTLRKVIGNWVWLGIFWAASIAYAQVYVGVHFPLDAIAGAFVGSAIGIITGTAFNKQFSFIIFDKQLVA